MGLVAEVVLVIVMSVFALPLSWTVHELSHGAASRLVGIPLFRVRLGPLAIDTPPTGLRLRYVGFKGRWAGVAQDLERASPQWLRARAAFVVAAGPLGELLVAIAAGVVALRGGGLPFWIGAVVAAASGLSNLLPLSDMDEYTDLWSDGRTLWELLVAPDRACAWLASMALTSAVRSERRRPRDLDGRWVAIAISVEPSLAGLALGRMIAHHRALDQGDGERSTGLLLSAATTGELLPPSWRAELAAWTAYSLARFHADVDGARRALDVIDDWSENQWTLDLASAALSLASNRPDSALTLCDWLLLTRWTEGDGYAAMLRDQVEALRADAEAAVRAGSAPEPGVPLDRRAKTRRDIPTDKAQAVAASLGQRGHQLQQDGRHEEAIAIYEDVVRRFGDDDDPQLRDQVALGLLNGGIALDQLGRKQEALAAWEEMVRRSGDPSDHWLRHCVFTAGYNRAATLQALGRHQEAVEAYDEVVSRFGDLAEPDDQARLAAAMAEKGSVLADLNRQSQALRVYDEVLRRFGDDQHPGTVSTVARTLLLKADALRKLGRPWEAVAATDEMLRRFGGSLDPAVAELVDHARREKQRAVRGAGGSRRRPKRQRSR